MIHGEVSWEQSSMDDAAPPLGGVLLASASTIGVSASPGEAARGEELLWTNLAGQPVLAWSARALSRVPGLAALVILVEPGREKQAEWLAGTLDGYCRITVHASSDSLDGITESLDALGDACRLAVLHQASRPVISVDTVLRGLQVALAYPECGAVACAPVRETIKRASGDLVLATLPREKLTRLCSPQWFPRAALAAAYRSCRDSEPSLGDPSLVAQVGGIRLVPFLADSEEILVRSKDDLAVAESMLTGNSGS